MDSERVDLKQFTHLELLDIWFLVPTLQQKSLTNSA